MAIANLILSHLSISIPFTLLVAPLGCGAHFVATRDRPLSRLRLVASLGRTHPATLRGSSGRLIRARPSTSLPFPIGKQPHHTSFETWRQRPTSNNPAEPAPGTLAFARKLDIGIIGP